MSHGDQRIDTPALGNYSEIVTIAPQLLAQKNRLIRYARSPIPTKDGERELVVYREEHDSQGVQEHVALVVGKPPKHGALVRVHSECVTSEVFGSLKCDCNEQLQGALDLMHAEGAGVVVYLRQEGRGIGLGNKVRAYALQASGADTIEANHQLGFATDLRSYRAAAEILEDLGIESVRILTNNPDKVRGLEADGIEVVERLPIQIPSNQHSRSYLDTKREEMGHFLKPESD